ncbi:MAG TPA: tRNA (adenosine(37)-N6)-threonylcarbamoyltransferase complex ATPase subunit type 1 TsaE [Candidatus Paceibacterota bacterium]|nr:tRNA (adenosine(37)-N6)-threonylcarbamoyltransferase complex ATPase subunit type 1 TsaE [Candidatus Paceibacterota bacterium]
MKIFQSSSSRKTADLGDSIARKLAAGRRPKRRVRAAVFALAGDLGAGKTTFTQGFARGLGVRRRVASPTFVLMRRYALSGPSSGRFGNLYHLDAYRIKKPDALEVLGLREIMADPENIVLVEWPENIKKLLPPGTVWVRFRHGRKENERGVIITG